jgi:hypothetical protein
MDDISEQTDASSAASFDRTAGGSLMTSSPIESFGVQLSRGS